MIDFLHFITGVVVGLWTFSVLVSIPPLFGWGSFQFSYGQAICTNDWPYSISFFVFIMTVAIFGPFALIVYAYLSIIRTVLKSRMRVMEHAGATTRRVDRTDIQLWKMSFVICIAFVICWSPISVVNCALITGWDIGNQWKILAMFFLYANPVVDPMIYAFMNGPFRRELRKLLKWKQIM